METKIRVHHPMGYPPQIAQKRLASRPAELSGKTVYLIDCRFDDGDILVEQMANWFHDHRPDVKIEVRRKSGVYTERDEALYTEIQQRGAAAVVAVGH